MSTDNSGVSRRGFLRKAMFGVAGTRIARVAMAATDAVVARLPYGIFKMGVQSYSLRHFNLDDCLDRTEKLGLHFIELYGGHFGVTTDAKSVEGLKDKLAKHHITALAFGVEGFGSNDADNRRKFEFAKLLGLKAITADPAPDSFASLDKLVAEFGIAIAIHNHGPGARYNKIDDTAKAIEGHHKLIGACIDTGHYLRSEEDPVRAAAVFGDRTYEVHLKDVDANHHFAILGHGTMNTVGLFRELQKHNFKNCVALEYEESEQNPVPDMEECLVAASAAIAKI